LSATPSGYFASVTALLASSNVDQSAGTPEGATQFSRRGEYEWSSIGKQLREKGLVE
jgi:hypothetical protein